MLTVPGHGSRRVLFERPAPPVHSSLDVASPDPGSPSRWAAKRFQEEHSTLKSVRLCGINGHRCYGALCAPCSPRRARRHRRDLMRAVGGSNPRYALLWTATVGSTPGRALSELWSELDSIQRYMVSGSWLSRRVDGYVRSVEVEHTPGGWHPHAHTLLVFRNELTRPEAVKLALAIRQRYLRAADLRGIAASARGQHVEVVPLSELRSTVGYITKSHMMTEPSQKPGTLTPSMLLRASIAGDADAYVLWTELERASHGRRTWQRGGMLVAPPKAKV